MWLLYRHVMAPPAALSRRVDKASSLDNILNTGAIVSFLHAEEKPDRG